MSRQAFRQAGDRMRMRGGRRLANTRLWKRRQRWSGAAHVPFQPPALAGSLRRAAPTSEGAHTGPARPGVPGATFSFSSSFAPWAVSFTRSVVLVPSWAPPPRPKVSFSLPSMPFCCGSSSATGWVGT